MRRHAVKPISALLDVALLLVLLTCSRGLDAFVFHPNICKSTLQGSPGRHCWCALSTTPLSPSGTRVVPLGNIGRLGEVRVRRPFFAPAAVDVGRGLVQRTRCYAVHGTQGTGVDGRTYHGAEANRREVSAQQQNRGGTGAGGEEAVGFGWLREFGNGKMDITGLVISTVLLMTAAAPLGYVARLADYPSLWREFSLVIVT